MLIAINKQTRAGRSLEAIAKILCADVKEVARQSKLGGLDLRFLQAYKCQQVNLQTLKRLTAVTDGEALAELAETMEMSGGRINHWQIDRLLAVREAVDSPIFKYLTLDEYRAKGGRVEEDLFETVGDAIQDPKVLYDLFDAKFKKSLKGMRSKGVEVIFSPYLKRDLALKERSTLHCSHESCAGEEVVSASADKIATALTKAYELASTGSPAERAAHANQVLQLKFDHARLMASPVELAAIQFGLNRDGQFDCIAYVRDADYAAYLEAQAAAAEAEAEAAGATDDTCSDEVGNDEDVDEVVAQPSRPVSTGPDIEVETEGLSAAVHGRLTTLAGHGLARSLAGDPIVALDLLLATMLSQVFERSHADLSQFVLQVRTMRQISDLTNVPGPAAPIAEQLKAVLAQYQTSEKSAFAFVQDLAMPEKLEILALITALQVSMAEVATYSLRKKARLEAALVAEALGHDMADIYSGDEDFYGQFTKKQLLDFVTQMGGDADELRSSKKDLIVREVTEMAATQRFVPPHLNFKLAGSEGQPDEQTIVEAAGPALGETAPPWEDTDTPEVLAAA